MAENDHASTRVNCLRQELHSRPRRLPLRHSQTDLKRRLHRNYGLPRKTLPPSFRWPSRQGIIPIMPRVPPHPVRHPYSRASWCRSLREPQVCDFTSQQRRSRRPRHFRRHRLYDPCIYTIVALCAWKLLTYRAAYAPRAT